MIFRRPIVSLFLVTLVLSASCVQAQTVTPEKTQAIRAFMDKTHMRSLTVETMTSMLGQVREREDLKAVPSSVWDKFGALTDSIANVIMDSAVRVYSKYYSTEEIQELNKIYDNPVMQRSLERTPQIMTDLSALGQQIGQQVMLNLLQTEMGDSTEQDGEAPAAVTPKKHAHK